MSAPQSERARFLRFIGTGGFAAGVNVASRWLLSLAMPYPAAVAVAYVFGMTTAFVLARIFVFEADADVKGQYARFGLVNVVAFIQVWLISVGLAEFAFPYIGFTWHAETIAHAIGVASPIVTSYLAHKHFSFAPRKSAG